MKLLVVRTGAMGDVIHGMLAVAGLRAQELDVEVGWVVEPHWEPLLRGTDGSMAMVDGVPLVNFLHRAETKAWGKAPMSLRTLRSVMRLRGELRDGLYDAAVDLQGSVRSAVIAKMSAATEVYGSVAPREKPAQWMYSKRAWLHEGHVVAQAAELMTLATGYVVKPVERLQFPVDTASAAWARVLFAGDERPVAMIAPRAGWGAKEWGAERYGALALRLSRKGMRVLVNALPGGDVVAAAVVTASDGTAEPVECSLPQLIALVGRVSVFIGGDTGPLHLAAASGVPTVGLFGPTDPARTGPWGSRSVSLRDSSSATNHRRLAETEAGLARIGVDQVYARVDSLLAKLDA